MGSPTPNIPVIDLSGLDGNASQCRATIGALAEACREWGFFQVVNHGVQPELIARIRDVWRGFFQLPTAEKRAYGYDPNTCEGYGSRRLGAKNCTGSDWGDYFHFNLLPENPRKWPARPTSLKNTVEEYEGEMVKLCRRLMRALSTSLGLDAEQLSTVFGEENVGAQLHANYYTKCPQPELTLGLSAHSDLGGITVLLADDSMKGLQVRKGGNWVSVQPLPGAFIVNLGDQIQILTNSIYKSVEYRVMVNDAQERLSLTFFYNPENDQLIYPIRNLVKSKNIYRPMTFIEYCSFVKSKGPKGKMQVHAQLGGSM